LPVAKGLWATVVTAGPIVREGFSNSDTGGVIVIIFLRRPEGLKLEEKEPITLNIY
jgi:hypothetical protein